VLDREVARVAAAVAEAALLIAQDDPEAALASALATVDTLLTRFLG